jgi:acyl carrier protein
MSPNEIRNAVFDILRDIAPDEDISQLNDEDAFRDQMELDSMDFLDIVLELRRRYVVQIPEEDYSKLASMQSTVEYLTPLLRETAKA